MMPHRAGGGRRHITPPLLSPLHIPPTAPTAHTAGGGGRPPPRSVPPPHRSPHHSLSDHSSLWLPSLPLSLALSLSLFRSFLFLHLFLFLFHFPIPILSLLPLIISVFGPLFHFLCLLILFLTHF